ncbi:hypothetical protein BJX61DRAFT_300323 [Aspergillus egyptiacus]|nr:hypothetical protein BJX61DRAFT_300323 [Aspergillus egyptiacus]
MAKAAAADGESAGFPAPPNLNPAPVEARSLSAITSVAFNPPAYPRNPAQKKLDPLVLYIVRVPGRKDVFLTPLKPPTKSSVSAEAINASLYYLHFATPDDEVLLQEYEQEREEQARLRKEGLIDDSDMPLPIPEFARLNNVRRKPVGGSKETDIKTHTPVPEQGVPTSSHRDPENEPPSIVVESTQPPGLPPRPTYSDGLSNAEAMASLTGTDERPPLPPRPLSGVQTHETFLDDNEPTKKKSNRWSAMSGYISKNVQRGRGKFEGSSPLRHSFDASRHQMRPTLSHELPPSYSPRGSPSRSPGQSPNRRSRDNGPSPQPGFHITLIRRDPTHGSQWNVATMSTPQLDDTGIDIEVSTPGYNRFAAQQEPLSLEGLNLSAEARSLLSRHPNAPSHSGQTAASQDASASRNPNQPRRFRRKLVVSKPHNAEEAHASMDLSGGRISLDSTPGSPVNLHDPSLSKLKRGYYTFNSPWNGVCAFSTSVNGRSLKCKHMIPSPGYPAPGNPPHENPAVTVAEIRFNTPFQAQHLHHPGCSHASPFTLSQTPLLKDPSVNPDPSAPYYYDPLAPAPSKRAAIAGFFNHNLKHRRSSNSSSSSAGGNDHPPPPPPPPPRRPPSDERLDLSLAREKAGGGMRGDSAKLGKLIIEDEGIKMLDLVVAACMAVWWRGYYY